MIIEPEELDGLDPVATHTIDILEFVDLDQIDPVYFDKPYYLVPDKRAEKAYALLAQSLESTGKVGIAKFVMRTKEYLAAIRSTQGRARHLDAALRRRGRARSRRSTRRASRPNSASAN